MDWSTASLISTSSSQVQHTHKRTILIEDLLVEGLIRRPERGKWLGAIKNSSRRSNSAYAPNSQPRNPTRVCQGRIATTELPTIRTNPKQSQRKNETQEAKDLAALRNTRRTVRKHRADCPRGLGGPPASLLRTVRKIALKLLVLHPQ
jgi:hypothetical protein